MSNVRDVDGNLITKFPPDVINGKYSDERALERDWFDLHPEARPIVEESVVVHKNPQYEDEHGNTWLFNEATQAWDIPVPAPSITKTIVEDGQPVAVIPDAEANAVVAGIAAEIAVEKIDLDPVEQIAAAASVVEAPTSSDVKTAEAAPGTPQS